MITRFSKISLPFTPELKKYFERLSWATRILYAIYVGLAVFVCGIIPSLLIKLYRCPGWERLPQPLLFKTSLLMIYGGLLFFGILSFTHLLSGQLESQLRQKLVTLREGEKVDIRETLQTQAWKRALFLMIGFIGSLIAFTGWFIVMGLWTFQ